ncbi:LuxR C-terminal-related transcriptional regulator [Microvirga lotononidis]|uniref:Response regulator containing a CheY-like receiver domain and an HTH DNA-binding domain n=1 Tax=Microvirga lotononidis TaxID=864069 RepID=I4YNT8_9HYPH|nr:response regulator transcription factor [Microvirga lotononidis]EIM25630.1 response regulator containing a CheY-like receiver domain and an HTH DNA-binding domain [Microvirga lotononidis]WQO26485.1 response regulator transcription factor [Microvirga lotononidis]
MIQDHSEHAAAPAAMATNSSQRVATKLLCGNVLLRAGLSQLLSGTGFDMAGSTGVAPDLCIVDATGDFQQTLELIRETKAQHPVSRVVAISQQFDVPGVQSAVDAGVDSFCLATSAREVLVRTLELTMLGERILPSSILRQLLTQEHSPAGAAQVIPLADHRMPDPKVSKLSPRETVILQSLMGGDPNKVIARKLDITEATIKVHVKAILRKIGVANRTQAAMWATGNLREAGSTAGDFREVRRLS